MAKILFEGSKSLSGIYKTLNTGNLQDDSIRYRLAKHVYLSSVSGERILVHTATGFGYLLSEAQWESVKELSSGKCDGVSGAWIEQHGLTEFLQNRVIVKLDFDDVKFYQSARTIRKTMKSAKNGKKGRGFYTILPTTACNARCVYCYEKGFVPSTMDERTALQTAEYIKSHYGEGAVKLNWFGGEPLVGEKYISVICDCLRASGIPFKSSMITNASLITPEIAGKMKEDWNMGKIQVSLDGPKATYEKRKQYYDPLRNTYESVMDCVETVARAEIETTARINVDYENAREMETYLEELFTRFGKYGNFSVYFASLYGIRGDGERYLELEKLVQKLNQKAIRLWNRKEKNGLRGSFKVRGNLCMADNVEGSLVILPDGSFNNCEHCPEGRSWGNVFEGTTDEALYRELKKDAPVMAECRDCPFLPLCTPYRKFGCPNREPHCRENYIIKADASLELMMESYKED